jgi:small subunit ribosomal protein S20
MLIGLRVRNRVPNIKSQKKRVITNAKANERNKAVKSELRTAERRVEDAIAAGDSDAAKTAAADAGRLLDKAASKGVIHKNTAANHKSKLAKDANAV